MGATTSNLDVSRFLVAFDDKFRRPVKFARKLIHNLSHTIRTPLNIFLASLLVCSNVGVSLVEIRSMFD